MPKQVSRQVQREQRNLLLRTVDRLSNGWKALTTTNDPNSIQSLRESVERKALKIQKQILEDSTFSGPNWMNDVVDPWEPLFDDPEFFLPMWGTEQLPPTLNKTLRGELLPVYITWYGLKVIRDLSRRMCVLNEFAVGAINNRQSYICGKGFQHRLIPKQNKENADTKYLCDLGQHVIDQFTSGQRWNELEQEAVMRCDRDGECFFRFFHVGKGKTEVRFIEPEWIQSPDEREWETYGIVNEKGDISDVLGYWVLEHPPIWKPTFVKAEEILHIKLNSDSTSKRGLPTFYPIRKNLERAEKLLRNMSILAQIQATFAMIRKHKQYSVAAIQTFQQQQADLSWTSAWSGNQKFGKQYAPGTILDVPACFDDKTQLLTRRGWLNQEMISEDDLAATMNMETGGFQWQPITKIHRHNYDGEMVRIETGKTLDIKVTPNHRMLASLRKGREGIYGDWETIYADEVKQDYILPNRLQPHKGTERTKEFEISVDGEVKKVPINIWLRFLGWWVTEGHTCVSARKKCTTGVCQSEKHKIECIDINYVMKRLPYNVREYHHKGIVRWTIFGKHLCQWLRRNCGTKSHNKRLPDFIFDLSNAQKELVLQAMLLGDGNDFRNGKGCVYYTTSRELADQVQLLALQCGYIVNENKPLKGTNHPIYQISIRYSHTRGYTLKKSSIYREHYKGIVWCVSVPNETIISRRNGKIILTKNSTDYEFPSQNVNAGALTSILQVELQAAGQRVNMPAYMFSGDTGNVNLATAFIAESPFVKNMERLQGFYAIRFGDGELSKLKNSGAMWRVLANAVDYGGLPRQILTDCEIQVEGPTLVVRDKAQETQRAAMLNQAGELSSDTWSKWEGVDHSQEFKKWKEEQLEKTTFQLKLQKIQAEAQMQMQMEQAQAQMQMQQQQMAVQQQQMAAQQQMGGGMPQQGQQQMDLSQMGGQQQQQMPGTVDPNMIQRDLQAPRSDSGFVSSQGGNMRDLLGLESVDPRVKELLQMVNTLNEKIVEDENGKSE